MEIDFYVMLSMEETVEKLKDGLNGRIVKAKLLDEYQRETADGKRIWQMVFQKYSVLANDRPVLVVMLDDLDGQTKVHLCGVSAVGGAFGVDLLEMGKELAMKAEDVLREYKVER